MANTANIGNSGNYGNYENTGNTVNTTNTVKILPIQQIIPINLDWEYLKYLRTTRFQKKYFLTFFKASLIHCLQGPITIISMQEGGAAGVAGMRGCAGGIRGGAGSQRGCANHALAQVATATILNTNVLIACFCDAECEIIIYGIWY